MAHPADRRPLALAASLLALAVWSCSPAGSSPSASPPGDTQPPTSTATQPSTAAPSSPAGWPGRIVTVVGQPDATTISIQTSAGVEFRTAGSAPAWSPDGRRIAYTRPSAGGLPGLWIADATANVGASPALVLPEVISVTWSPKGTWLAIGRSPIDFGDSWLVKLDGTSLTALAVRGAETRVDLWSPDGSRVAGIASMGGAVAPVVAICGVPSTSCSTYGRGTPEAWAPDGASLAVVGGPTGSVGPFAFDPATGTITPLLAAGPSITGLSWSAGGRIAMTGEDGSLLVLDHVGGEARRVASDLVASGRPSWSPDGRWLSIVARTAAGQDVVLLEVDGTGRATITDGGAAVAASWAPVP